jgi:glycosyltransferase involved in cell wall biosynthesis
MSQLSILICHTPDRQDYLRRLNAILDPQLEKFKDVKVFIDDSRYKSIGKKRNDLMSRADGKYVAFIDDDDRISDNYLKLVTEGIKRNVDCCSLVGEITVDGLNPKKFIHSLKYNDYFEKDNVYYRCPNHLNVIKREIASRFRFPEKNHSEDTEWAMSICSAGAIQSEYEINQTIYFYDYRSRK